MNDRDLKRNAEGYLDLTAYEAIKKADRMNDYERHSKCIGCMLRIAELSGYSVEERIILRDKETGDIWR